MPMRRLGANIDHVATVSQARQVLYPDPVVAAAISRIGRCGSDHVSHTLRQKTYPRCRPSPSPRHCSNTTQRRIWRLQRK